MTSRPSSFDARRYGGHRVDWRADRPLVAGFSIAIVAAALFVALAWALTHGNALAALDLRLAEWMARHSAMRITQAMTWTSEVHRTWVVLMLVAAFALVIARRRQWDWLACLLVTVPGGMLMNFLIKDLIARPRPRFPDVVAPTSYSFPSGHTAAATLFYGFLAAYLIGLTNSRGVRVLIGVVALVMVIDVAFSRVYLRVHYASDVVAALCESIAWLALWLSVMRARRSLGAPQG